jgi:geranylgeranyl diphosphate synthase, type I
MTTERAAQSSLLAPRHSGVSLSSDEHAFQVFLEKIRIEMEQRLVLRFDAKRRELERYGEHILAMLLAGSDLTLRGGKRFRAALLAAAYQGVDPGAPMSVALDAGVALEMLQTYLLVQDDWMDGDATRRGGPSVHAALAARFDSAHLGAACAILTSDLTWGFSLDTLASLDVPAPRLVQALRFFLKVHEDVVVGQHMDVLGSAGDVEVMHALKTGSYTVRGPILLGAMLAGAPAQTLSALERFAEPLGVAFQVRDDLLGTFGTTDQTGKPVGNDLTAGKRTILVTEAQRLLDADRWRRVERVLGDRDAPAAAVGDAKDAMVDGGVLDAVILRLNTLCDQAEHAAEELPVSADAATLLRGAVSMLRMVHRENPA